MKRAPKILVMVFVFTLLPVMAFSAGFRVPARCDLQKPGDIPPLPTLPITPEACLPGESSLKSMVPDMQSFASLVVSGEIVPLTLFGGWKFDVTNRTEETYSWEIEESIFGNTSLGLIKAYQTYGGDKYLSDAKAIGDCLLASPMDEIQAQDTIFLYRLSQTSGNESYKFKGEERMVNLNSKYGSGEMYALYNQEPQRKHWHLGSWIEAANLYEEEAWAYERLDEVLRDQGELGGFYFDGTQDHTGIHVSTLGQAKLVEVLHKYYRDEKSEELKAALLYLLALQEPSGPEKGAFNWAGVDDGNEGGNSVIPFQEINIKSHAIALMALKECEDMTEVNSTTIEDALSYIENSQITDTPSGGWYDWGNDLPIGVAKRIEASEYDGEVIHAISLVGKEESLDMVKAACDRLVMLRNKVEEVPQIVITPTEGKLMHFMIRRFFANGGSLHEGKVWYTWYENSGGELARIFPHYEEGILPEYKFLRSKLSRSAWFMAKRPGVVNIAAFDENGYSTTATVEIDSWLP